MHYHLTKTLGFVIRYEFLQGAQAEMPRMPTQGTEVHLNKTFSRVGGYSDCQVALYLVMTFAGMMSAAMLCRHWDKTP
jgi:hypothetical protein